MSDKTAGKWTWEQIAAGRSPAGERFTERRALWFTPDPADAQATSHNAVYAEYGVPLYDRIPWMCDALNAAEALRSTDSGVEGLLARADSWIQNLHPNVRGLAEFTTQGALVRDLAAALRSLSVQPPEVERLRSAAAGIFLAYAPAERDTRPERWQELYEALMDLSALLDPQRKPKP